jgi:uncharacterized membrane protein
MAETLNAIRSTVGHFHPALVHFPVALLLSGAALEAWQIATGGGFRSGIARTLLLLGLAGALAAMLSGLLLFRPEDFRGRTLEVVRIHRVLGLGTGTAALAAAAGGLVKGPGPTGRRLWLYRSLYFLTAGLAGLAAHYGGWIVFGWGRVWTF